MSSKIKGPGSVFETAKDSVKKGGADQASQEWNGQLQTSGKSKPASTHQTMKNVKFDRAPSNVTNQNGELTNEHLSQRLSQEISKRNGRKKLSKKSKSQRKGKSHLLDQDPDHLDDYDEERDGFLNPMDQDDVLEYLAYFDETIQQYLDGTENFSNIKYFIDTFDESDLKYYRK